MGSGGGIWDSNDTPEKARLNQKTTYVGTTAGIAALATTYPGQLAYDTSLDTLYVRNAANSAWVTVKTVTDVMAESSTTNTTPVVDTTNFDAVAGTRYYSFFTLPTTDPLYIITNITWQNGTTKAGTIISGVDIVNANPPTLASTPLVALGLEVTAAGSADADQSCGFVTSKPIRGGTILGVWINCSSSTTDLRKIVLGGAQNKQKTIAYSASPGTSDSTAWTSTTDEMNIYATYRSYY